MKRVAVIAGTPVDTRMGVDYLEKKNEEAGERLVETVYLPAAEDCNAQIKLQYADDDLKRAVMDNLFDPEIEAGTRDFFIYCNSLSGSFDFDTYAVGKSMEAGADINIYTPLQVYRKLGGLYSCIGVMAANNISSHAIEEAFMASNQDIYVVGTGSMPVVRAIEEDIPPADIVKNLGLADMASYMKACGAEAIVLGCTHFPYFKDELAACTDLPLIDPAEEMYKALI